MAYCYQNPMVPFMKLSWGSNLNVAILMLPIKVYLIKTYWVSQYSKTNRKSCEDLPQGFQIALAVTVKKCPYSK